MFMMPSLKRIMIVVKPYFIAETTMPGKTGFDFNGASQSFNVLAEYLFGKVVRIFHAKLEHFFLELPLLICLFQMFGACRIQVRRQWR